jgi:hypothetical protein
MSVRSSAPPRAGIVYTSLVILGLLAAALGASTIGVIVYNYTSREELRNPVPLIEEHTALPFWIELV